MDNPVSLTLTPALAKKIYEALSFYANRFSYDPWENVPDLFGRRSWSSAPTIDELTGLAQSALDAWNATRASRPAADPPQPARDYEADAIREMCPNCVTPWKCNGPHVTPQPAVKVPVADLITDDTALMFIKASELTFNQWLERFGHMLNAARVEGAGS